MPDTDAGRTERLFAVLQKALGHELPNMLIGVQGLVRLLDLEQGERLDAEGRDYLARIAAGAAKAHALTTALAELARLGKGTTPIEAVDLGEMIGEAVAAANQLAPSRFAVYHGGKQVLIVAVPRVALRKVLGLLLRCAGSVRPGESPRHVEVSARATEKDVEVRVAEEGPPLLPAPIARLFEPFATGDTRGLEMFLVRQLAEDWGGGVRVEAKPGSGNVFVVNCPLVRSP